MNHTHESEDSTFEDEMKALKGLAELMKWVIAGAVALGMWAGALQLQVLASAKAGDTNSDRIRELEIRGASEREKLQNIYETVQRIDRKLNP